jgi:hypothetical protein
LASAAAAAAVRVTVCGPAGGCPGRRARYAWNAALFILLLVREWAAELAAGGEGTMGTSVVVGRGMVSLLDRLESVESSGETASAPS